MELTKTNQELTNAVDPIEKMTEQYRPFILALRGDSLKKNSINTNLKSLVIIISKTSALKGSIIVDNESDLYLAEKFYELIMEKYPHATLGEIELAFKKGVLGDYGEYFGINVKTLWGWFKSYIQSNELIQAKREWVNLVELPRSETPKLDLKVEMKQSILNAFKRFCEDGEIPVCGSQYYTVMCQIKGVKSVIEDKALRAEIREKAFINYKRKLIEKKYHKTNEKDFNILLDTALKGSNASYDSESRKLALKFYFELCQKEGKLPI